MSSGKKIAPNQYADSFDELYVRFRNAVLQKVTRSDVKSTDAIILTVYDKLLENALNGKPSEPNRPRGLSMIEFKIGVRKILSGFGLVDIRYLFIYFDANEDGRISPEEFIIGVKGKLNQYRQALVEFVFQLLDKNCSGFIEEKELTEYLRQTGTPGIISGKVLKPEKKCKEIIKKVGKEKEGVISLHDLEELYVDRGLFIQDDVMFKYQVLDDWLFSEELCNIYMKNIAPSFTATGAVRRGQSMNAAAMKFAMRRASIDSNASNTSRSSRQGKSGGGLVVKASMLAQSPNSSSKDRAGASSPQLTDPSKPATTSQKDAFDDLLARFRYSVIQKATRFETGDSNQIIVSVYDLMLDEALNGKPAPPDRPPGINMIEFKIGVRKLFTGFTLEDIKYLYTYFDVDGDGRILPQEFVLGIKGSLNPYRQSLVEFLFQLLDRNCSGFIEENELTEYFKQANNPTIVSGAGSGKVLSPEQRSRAVIGMIGRERPGAISLHDLEDYYIDKALFIDDDIAFRREMVDAWQFSDDMCDVYMRNIIPNVTSNVAARKSRTVVQAHMQMALKAAHMDPSGAAVHAPSAPNAPRSSTAQSPRQVYYTEAQVNDINLEEDRRRSSDRLYFTELEPIEEAEIDDMTVYTRKLKAASMRMMAEASAKEREAKEAGEGQPSAQDQAAMMKSASKRTPLLKMQSAAGQAQLGGPVQAMQAAATLDTAVAAIDYHKQQLLQQQEVMRKLEEAMKQKMLLQQQQKERELQEQKEAEAKKAQLNRSVSNDKIMAMVQMIESLKQQVADQAAAMEEQQNKLNEQQKTLASYQEIIKSQRDVIANQQQMLTAFQSTMGL